MVCHGRARHSTGMKQVRMFWTTVVRHCRGRFGVWIRSLLSVCDTVIHIVQVNLVFIILNLGFRVWRIFRPCAFRVLGSVWVCLCWPTGIVNSELRLKWHLHFGNLTWDSRRNAHIESKTGISCLCGSMLKIDRQCHFWRFVKLLEADWLNGW